MKSPVFIQSSYNNRKQFTRRSITFDIWANDGRYIDTSESAGEKKTNSSLIWRYCTRMSRRCLLDKRNRETISTVPFAGRASWTGEITRTTIGVNNMIVPTYNTTIILWSYILRAFCRAVEFLRPPRRFSAIPMQTVGRQYKTDTELNNEIINTRPSSSVYE